MKKDYKLPSVTVDVALFTYTEKRLQVLLIRRRTEPFAGTWALPGGFVDENEPLAAAAARELYEETTIQDVYLEQLATFGDPGRDPRGWVISVAYLALTAADTIATTRAGDDASEAAWFNIVDLPSLAFDHDLILGTALRRLQWHMRYTTLGFHLLADEFTLSALQDVYETVLQMVLDKRNFRRKFLALGILEETGNRQYGDYRPARLYRLTDTDLELDKIRAPLP